MIFLDIVDRSHLAEDIDGVLEALQLDAIKTATGDFMS